MFSARRPGDLEWCRWIGQGISIWLDSGKVEEEYEGVPLVASLRINLKRQWKGWWWQGRIERLTLRDEDDGGDRQMP